MEIARPSNSAAGGAEVRETAHLRTPLTELQTRRACFEQELREKILVAALQGAGERGYRALRVQDILERYGGHRAQFYGRFANKEECYATACATHLRRLTDRLLDCGRDDDWTAALRRALSELSHFLAADPLLARGLLVEIQVAGHPAVHERERALRRLCVAVDSARAVAAEVEPGGHSAPPRTAPFMVGVIEEAVAMSLLANDPGRFAAATAELERLIRIAYFGDAR